MDKQTRGEIVYEWEGEEEEEEEEEERKRDRGREGGEERTREMKDNVFKSYNKLDKCLSKGDAHSNRMLKLCFCRVSYISASLMKE